MRTWNSLGEDEEVLGENIPWGNISTSTAVQGANANAWASDSEIGASVLSAPGSGIWAESDAGESRYLGFEIIEGAGYVHVSIDYYLEQNLKTNNIGENAEGFSWVGLYIGDDPSPGALPWPYLDDSILTNTVSDGISITDNRSGTLYGSFYFEYSTIGENYGKTFLEVGNTAYAQTIETSPIPEPSTWLLLCFSLVGIVGIKKRRLVYKALNIRP